MVKSRWKNGIPNSVRQKIKDKEKMAKIRAKIERGVSKPKVGKTGVNKGFIPEGGELWKVGNKLVPAKNVGVNFIFNNETLRKLSEHKSTVQGFGITGLREENGYYVSTVEVTLKKGSKKITQKRDFWVKDGQGYFPVPFDLTELDKTPAKGVPKDTPGLPNPFNKNAMKKLTAFVMLNTPTLMSGTPFVTNGFAPPMTREDYNARRREKYAQGNQTPVIDDRTVLLHNGEGEIAHIYKPKSRVMPAGKGYIAVKLKTGEKGWIKQGGRMFISSDDVGFMLECVEKAALCRGRYTTMYNAMTTKQKAEFVAQSHNIDWTAFWKVHYNPRTGLLDNEGVEIIEEIFNNIKS